LEPKTPAQRLTAIREKLEEGTGKQIEAIRVSAGCLMNDIMTALDYSKEERRQVLGSSFPEDELGD
jgi:hypothetical protein